MIYCKNCKWLRRKWKPCCGNMWWCKKKFRNYRDLADKNLELVPSTKCAYKRKWWKVWVGK